MMLVQVKRLHQRYRKLGHFVPHAHLILITTSYHNALQRWQQTIAEGYLTQQYVL
jgi:hypothetical protein